MGKYVSDNSRSGYWGKGAIKQLSDDLQQELPGLRGFTEGQLKKMRLFYEEWSTIFTNRSLITNDFTRIPKMLSNTASDDMTLQIYHTREGTDIDLGLLARHLHNIESPDFDTSAFMKVGFTHHSEILAKENSRPPAWLKSGRARVLSYQRADKGRSAEYFKRQIRAYDIVAVNKLAYL